jgi:hypothetical protein
LSCLLGSYSRSSVARVGTISFTLAQFWLSRWRDVRAARKELESRGVEFVTDVDGNESEAWTYFHGPDGYLYELWQTARALKALPPTSS